MYSASGHRSRSPGHWGCPASARITCSNTPDFNHAENTPRPGEDVRNIVFAPDIVIFKSDTGAQVHGLWPFEAGGNRESIQTLLWSPDGAYVLAAIWHRRVFSGDPPRGHPPRLRPCDTIWRLPPYRTGRRGRHCSNHRAFACHGGRRGGGARGADTHGGSQGQDGEEGGHLFHRRGGRGGSRFIHGDPRLPHAGARDKRNQQERRSEAASTSVTWTLLGGARPLPGGSGFSSEGSPV